MKKGYLLPSVLFKEIQQLNFSNYYKRKLLSIARAIYSSYFEDKTDLTKPISKKYLTSISEDFRKNIWPHVIHNTKKDGSDIPPHKIFITDGYFSTKHKKPLYYSIHPRFLLGEEYEFIPHLEKEKRANENDIGHLFPKQIEYTFHCLSQIELDEKTIKNIQEEYMVIPNNVDEFSVKVERHNQFYPHNIADIDFFEMVKNDFGQPVHNTTYCKLKVHVSRLRQELKNDDICLIINGESARISEWHKNYDLFELAMHTTINSNIYAFRNKIFNCKILETTGRLYSNMTNAHKKLIKYLQVGGNNLMGLDLANSQMMILLNLFCQNRVFLDSISKSKFGQLHKYMNVFNNCQIDADGAKKTLQHVVETKADIYAELASVNKASRQEMKLRVFKFLFTEPAFERRFPVHYPNEYSGFFKNLSVLKLALKKELGSAKKHLSPFLSLIEGHIFLENIYPVFIKENIWALTKHDAILIQNKPEIREKGINIMLEQFAKKGFHGQIKIEHEVPIDFNDIKYNTPFYNLLLQMPQNYSTDNSFL